MSVIYICLGYILQDILHMFVKHYFVDIIVKIIIVYLIHNRKISTSFY